MWVTSVAGVSWMVDIMQVLVRKAVVVDVYDPLGLGAFNL